MTIILTNLNRLKKFTRKFLGKFVVKWILKLAPHLALPSDTLMSAKKAINDKLIGSVKCDEVVNNQIKKELLLSL